MKTKFFFFFALALTAVLFGCRTVSSGNQQSGPVTDGLQLSLSVAMTNPKDPVFEVAIQNVGDKDVCVNLGTMLGNGREMFPDKIQLNLVDYHGKSRKLQFAGPVSISGRMDDYVVSLRAGSAYTIKLRLDQFWSPETQEFTLKLKPGKYRVTAQFQGTGAETINTGMEGMRLMNFWKGNLQSNPVFITE